jgi:hypothetical protein
VRMNHRPNERQGRNGDAEKHEGQAECNPNHVVMGHQ